MTALKAYDPNVSAPPFPSTYDGDGPLDVLVVEDHAATKRAIELTLGHLGHLVFTAPTLADARHLLCAFEIDVVICDVRLPDGDGVSFLKNWPKESRRVPAVAISGLPDPALQAQCLKAGFDAFLPKPLHVGALCRTIRRLTHPAN